MPITGTQAKVEERRKRLGGSDLAAIVGVDPYRNGGDVWLEKTGQVEPLEPSPAMIAGTHFEGAVLDWAREQLGELKRNQYRSRPDLCLGTHADAHVVDGGIPVEAKTSGLFGPLPDGWGDDGTNEVPDSVWVQCHGHMLVSVTKTCHVPAFLGGRGFAMFHVDWDPDFGDQLAELCPRWWDDYVVGNTAPPDDVPHLETLKRRFRYQGDPAAVSGLLIDECQAATAARKVADDTQEEAKAAVVMALGDCEWGQADDGRIVTYRLQSSRRVDTAMLKSKGLYNDNVKTSTFPVLRFPKKTTKLMKELEVA